MNLVFCIFKQMLNHLHLFSQQLQLDNFFGVLHSLLVSEEVQGLFLELFGPDGLLIVDVRPLVFDWELLLNLKIRGDLLEQIVQTVTQLVVLLVIGCGEKLRIGLLSGAEEGIGKSWLLSLGGHGIVKKKATGALRLGKFLEGLQLWVGEQV